VSGVVARARVAQRFHNPSAEWIEAVYVFPLPESAAVDRLRMRIGERVVEGVIREREAARRRYEQARGEGRRAGLIEQERANIFTSSVANVGPGEEIRVEIEYQQSVRYDAGAFRLRFPMVVGPRYIPGSTMVAGVAGTGWARNTDVVSDAARITPPVLRPGHRPVNPVALRVEVAGGFPLAGIESPHHRVNVEPGPDGASIVTLAEGAVPADRDFELAWTPAPGRAPQAALLAKNGKGRIYMLVMVMPPRATEAAVRLPREVIYVIDTSGSMAGTSIEQARAALALALERLGPHDRFNVIEFNSLATALFERARAFGPDTLAQARAFVRRLRADGGTEMAAALQLALDGRRDEGLVRQVIFLTDGAVGNEDRLLRLIEERLGASRLFTVGIGSAPNGHFMTKAARFGRGSYTYIGNVAEVGRKMSELFARIESPVLTDIEVQWPAGGRVEMWPRRVPDLYAGEPVVVSAAFEGAPREVVVTGRRGGEAWRAVLPLAGAGAHAGVDVLWARHKIADLMDDMRRGSPPEELRKAVIEVAMEHHLVSRYTSLVAVDTTPARPQGSTAHTAAVPTHLPHGWQYDTVFGELPQTATPAALHALAGLVALMLAAACWLARRGRRAARA
jgi:Ca-activated chloride channel family protein